MDHPDKLVSFEYSCYELIRESLCEFEKACAKMTKSSKANDCLPLLDRRLRCFKSKYGECMNTYSCYFPLSS